MLSGRPGTVLFQTSVRIVAFSSILSVTAAIPKTIQDLPTDDKLNLARLISLLGDHSVQMELELSERQVDEFEKTLNAHREFEKDLHTELRAKQKAGKSAIGLINKSLENQQRTYQKLKVILLVDQLKRLTQIIHQQDFSVRKGKRNQGYLLNSRVIDILGVDKKTESRLKMQQRKCVDSLVTIKQEYETKVSRILENLEKDFKKKLSEKNQNKLNIVFGKRIDLSKSSKR